MHVHSTHSSPVAWVADRIASVPPALRRRAVVVTTSESFAHAVRREVAVTRGRPDLLAGIDFRRPVDLAREVLLHSGEARVVGWEPLRAARILQLLQSASLAAHLAYFEASQLRTGQGYADALAAAILDLEASGLEPEHLDAVAARLADDPRSAARLRDLAVVWRAADADRGAWRTASQVLAEAARVLATANDPPPAATPTPATGQLSFDQLLAARTETPEPAAPRRLDLPPIFAALTASPSAVLVRFLAALPEAEVVVQDARPLRTDTHRWRAVVGVEPAAPPAEPLDSELALVRRFLFEIPEALTDPERPRSAGPDGSVDFEEHAGIEDEIEATATWVVEQVAGGTPLERIGVVIPEKGSYAALVVDRLARCDAGAIDAYVAGGLSFADAPAGRRYLALLAALERGLDLDATLRIVPALRRGGQAADAPATRLSPSRAAEIVYDAGIPGGGAGDREGLRLWSVKLRARRDQHAALAAAVESEEQPSRPRRITAANANRWLRDVEPILPAVDALQELAVAVADGVPFAALWPRLHDFVRRHFLLPPDPPGFAAVVEQRIAPALVDPIVAGLPASLGLRWLAHRLRQERWPVGRFGDPRVFVGSPSQAAGIAFDAVRIVGLAEGGLPRTPHDDPIIPDDLRREIESVARAVVPDTVVPRLADRVLDDLHGVFRAVAGARRHLSLSVPRQWVDRSEREVSGIVLEVATALSRVPDGEDRGDGGDVPTSGRLRSVYFAAGDAVRRSAQRRWLANDRAALTLVATTTAGDGLRVPPEWLAAGALDLGRVRAIAALDAGLAIGANDGVVGELFRRWQPLGTPERPISASALHLLLGCPHRFLLERALHWREPPQRPTTDAIEPIAYGTLFHHVAETFLREAGPQICRKEGSPEWWSRRAREIADAELEQLLQRYPLRGREARERERQRLFAQIDSLVRDEWDRPQRAFVAVELDFGNDRRVGLAAGDEPMFFWGAIDRVDELPDATLSVRDIKTGRVRDLAEEEVNAGRDLQIGLYSLVVDALHGGERKVSEAAYVHPSVAQEPERAFRGAQLDGLQRRSLGWLQIASRLLANGTFVRTPSVDDCRTCPFVPRCGAGAQERSARKLAALPQTDDLAAFLAMKQERKFDE